MVFFSTSLNRVDAFVGCLTLHPPLGQKVAQHLPSNHRAILGFPFRYLAFFKNKTCIDATKIIMFQFVAKIYIRQQTRFRDALYMCNFSPHEHEIQNCALLWHIPSFRCTIKEIAIPGTAFPFFPKARASPASAETHCSS